MAISKSTLFLGAVCLIATSVTGSRASAQNQVTAPVATEAELLTALDNSIWIADGKSSEKQIYVIAGPCCPDSRILYQRSRQFHGGAQLRWIEVPWPTDQRCLGYLAEAAVKNDAGVLVDMYQTQAVPESAPRGIKDNAVEWNNGAYYTLLAFLHVTSMRFPTVVWLSKDGVRSQLRPADLDSIAQRVVARPEAANIDPASRIFLNAEHLVSPIPRKNYFALNDATKLYAQPASTSRVLGVLKKNNGFPGKSRVIVGNEAWIELAMQAQDSFVRESEVYTEK
jgi:hypothetical protein